MDSRSLKFVASACAGEQVSGSPDLLVGRVCSDSRQAQAGDLFFAIAGERFDGHDFIQEVAQKGVAAVVASRNRVPPATSCAVVVVDDPRRSLGQLAARYRADLGLLVIAVGGSNGKTTTKDLIASVLNRKLNTVSSEASFNNDIGVPLTLLRIDSRYQAAVLEVGTNHPGELAPLVRMVQPRIGVIVSIGREHLEFFGDMNGVVAEEGWLAELLPADGILFVNGDNEWCGRIAQRSHARVVRVGLAETNDWRADELAVDESGVSFRVDGPVAGIGGDYRVNLVGRHQAANALFAVAIGAELGLSRAEIQQGLAACQPPKMRMQSWQWNGVRVLDDAYNANADSMQAALKTLADLPCAGRRMAVLGDMAELGTHAGPAHEEAGRLAAELGVDRLLAVGTMAGVTADAARSAGIKAVDEFADVNAAAAAIPGLVLPGDLLLLKASRAAHFEKIADALRSSETRKTAE